jgi:hypothetical protein
MTISTWEEEWRSTAIDGISDALMLVDEERQILLSWLCAATIVNLSKDH